MLERGPVVTSSASPWPKSIRGSALCWASSNRLLKGSPPVADAFETNDDAGSSAKRISGTHGTIKATVDFWDDQIDVYAIQVRAGQTLTATFAGPIDTAENLLLWSPQTQSVTLFANSALRVAQSTKPGSRQRLAYKVPPGASGLYDLEVKIAQPGAGRYALTFAKR